VSIGLGEDQSVAVEQLEAELVQQVVGAERIGEVGRVAGRGQRRRRLLLCLLSGSRVAARRRHRLRLGQVGRRARVHVVAGHHDGRRIRVQTTRRGA
jgi:hypothetical protein